MTRRAAPAVPAALAPVLVAPDSFKGTLHAAEVAVAVARGLRAAGQDAQELPIGDGGECTMDALIYALGGEYLETEVEDPVGRPVHARFALLDSGKTAVVETAQARGLHLVAERDRDPWAASTGGTGQLIAAAAATGASELVVTVGGTATTDGGRGALEALAETDLPARLLVACDVRTPWEEAAPVFAPQKGADPKTVRRLERRLAALARSAPRDPRGVAMTGCGGGLSGALWSHHGALLVPGPSFVLDRVGFDQRMRSARFVVTGEGRLDEQTLAGKAVAEVATRCRQAGVACHAVVGSDSLDRFRARVLDLASVREASRVPDLERAGRELAEATRA